jgi:DNA repair protein SbcD/Mre11
VAIDQRTSPDDLQGLLRQRLQALLETTPKIDLMISWTVAGSGPLMDELRQGTLSADVLEGLRAEHGRASPAAWSVSLDVEPDAALPSALYEQETILGDFLRAIRQYENNADAPLGLEAYVAESHQAGTLASAVEIPDAAVRQRVLREAALLGLKLLGEDVGQIS